ncbi:hypothetical protein KUCAC02_007034, partial [Chaenocephalus aceratus]
FSFLNPSAFLSIEAEMFFTKDDSTDTTLLTPRSTCSSAFLSLSSFSFSVLCFRQLFSAHPSCLRLHFSPILVT